MDWSRGSWLSQLGVVLLFPPSEASLELETALPVSAQSTPPSARVFKVDGFSWVLDEPVHDILGRAVLATEDDDFLGDVGVHSHGDGSRVRMTHVAEDEVVSLHERRVRTSCLVTLHCWKSRLD